MSPRLGDVYWVQPERLNPSVPGRPHPQVVVQADVLNRSRLSTVVVCGLTTDMGRGSEPGNVTLEEGEAGLRKRSVVIVSQVSSVLKSELGEYVGTLSEHRRLQLTAAGHFGSAESSFAHCTGTHCHGS